ELPREALREHDLRLRSLGWRHADEEARGQATRLGHEQEMVADVVDPIRSTVELSRLEPENRDVEALAGRLRLGSERDLIDLTVAQGAPGQGAFDDARVRIDSLRDPLSELGRGASGRGFARIDEETQVRGGERVESAHRDPDAIAGRERSS